MGVKVCAASAIKQLECVVDAQTKSDTEYAYRHRQASLILMLKSKIHKGSDSLFRCSVLGRNAKYEAMVMLPSSRIRIRAA